MTGSISILMLPFRAASPIMLFLSFLLMNDSMLAQNNSSSLPELVFPAGVGVNIHFVNGASMWSNKLNVEDPSYGPKNRHMLDMIAAAGFKFIRMDMYWQDIEMNKGVYDWAPYDTLVSELNQRGIRALFILDYNNTLYSSSVHWGPQDSTNIAAFANWAAATAKHFQGKHIIWEVWNEPNLNVSWEPAYNLIQYAALLIATAKAIRSVVPNAVIVAPALDGTEINLLRTLFTAGILKYINGLSLHPYRDGPPPRIPETVGPDFQKVRSLMNQYTPAGDTIPIISSEWGFSTYNGPKGISSQTQADYFARMQLFNLYSGVPLSIWYDWKNDGYLNTIGRHRGVVDYYLKPKQAYISVTVLTRELSGYHVSGRYNDSDTSDVILVMKNAGDSVKVVAWTTGTPHSVSLPLSSFSIPGTARIIYWVNTNSDTGTVSVKSWSFTDGLSGTPKIYSLFPLVSGVPVPTIPALNLPVTSTNKVVRDAIFKWNASVSYFPMKYHIQISKDSAVSSGGSFPKQFVIFDSTLTDTSVHLYQPLDSNTAYYWHVNASDIGGTSRFSGINFFKTGTDISLPSLPRLILPSLYATNVTREPVFKWNIPAYSKSYQFQLADNYFVHKSGDSAGGFISTNIVFDTTLTDTSFQLSFLLDSLTKYFWHIRAINSSGTSDWANSPLYFFTTGTEITNVEENQNVIPQKFKLYQNFPNPFNPGTIINYSIPKSGFVLLKIYDILGRKVKTLVDKFQNAGTYRVDFNASGLANGIYLYQLQSNGHKQTKKMMLIK